MALVCLSMCNSSMANSQMLGLSFILCHTLFSRCLAENNWNYEKSASVFSDLNVSRGFNTHVNSLTLTINKYIRCVSTY